MAQKDKLFVLIKSLTTGERAFFSKHSRTHSVKEKPDYLRLFDFLDDLEEYDEAAIKTHFQKDKFIKQLARKKSQLRDKIVESLSLFHTNESKESLLRQQMNVLPILRQKATYDHALVKEFEKQIKSIKETANRYEYFDILIKLADWERELIELKDEKNKKGKQLLDLIKETEQYQKKLTQEIQLQSIAEQLKIIVTKDLHFKKPANRNIVESMFNNLPDEQFHPLLSQRSLLYYYSVKSNYFRIKGDHTKAYNYARKRVEVYENINDYSYESMAEYKRILCDQIVTTGRANAFHNFFEILEKMKSCGMGDDDPYTLNTVLFTTLGFWMRRLELGKALEVAEEIEEKYHIIQPVIRRRRAAAYGYNLMVTYWLNDRLEEAVHWLNHILNDYDMSEEAGRFVYSTRIVQLAIYYDYDDKHLENRIHSARRVVANQGRLFEFEEIVFVCFRKLIRCVNKKEELSVISDFHDVLIGFKKKFPERVDGLWECMKVWCERQGVVPEYLHLIHERRAIREAAEANAQ